MPSVFPLNIIPKEDSPARVEKLANVDPKYYLTAEETNKMVEALDELKGNINTINNDGIDFSLLPTATLPLTTEPILIFQDEVLKKITNGNLIGSIPDATTTVRGLVNIGTQTFRGNKTIIGESTTVGNAFEIKNSSLTSLVKVGNNGNVGIGVGVPEYKLDVAGHLRLDGNYVIQIKSASSDYLVLSKSGTLDGGIYSGVGNLILQNNLRNVAIGGVTPTAKLSVISSSSTTGSAFDIKNSSGLQVATFNNNRGIEFGDSANPNYSTFFKVHGYMQATRFYIGTSTAYLSNDGVGMRVVGGYMVVEGTPVNPVSILAMRKSTIGYVNDPTTPTSEMLNVYGNIKIGGTANGILMYTPDGSHQYKLSIDNNGLPVTTLIS